MGLSQADLQNAYRGTYTMNVEKPVETTNTEIFAQMVTLLTQVVDDASITVAATDCEKLRAMWTKLGNALEDLCPVLAGPAVCSLGQFLPKPGTIE